MLLLVCALLCFVSFVCLCILCIVCVCVLRCVLEEEGGERGSIPRGLIMLDERLVTADLRLNKRLE